MKKIYEKLLKKYGLQGWWPLIEIGQVKYKKGNKNYGGYHPGDYSYPKTQEQKFEICCGAILTQNTSWNQASKALLNLYKQDLLDPESIIKTPKEKLQKTIRPAGYFRQKTKKLKIFSKFFIGLDGKIPTREQLLDIWGIGPETADSILLYAYKQPEFVVDAYTKRFLLKKRLISKKAKYDEIKTLLEDNLEKDYKMFQEYHALIVEDGKSQS